VQEITQRTQEARGARERVAEVEAFLKARLRPDRAFPNVRDAVEQTIAAGGCRSVGELARMRNLSSRQLQRWFRNNVGIGPKVLGRIARFQRALDIRASGSSWGMTAHAAGYQDQSHLANECRALSGLSPVQVYARRRSTALAKYFNAGPGVSPFCRTLYV
jgi:AraC-like DNA-binding protein